VRVSRGGVLAVGHSVPVGVAGLDALGGAGPIGAGHRRAAWVVGSGVLDIRYAVSVAVLEAAGQGPRLPARIAGVAVLAAVVPAAVRVGVLVVTDGISVEVAPLERVVGEGVLVVVDAIAIPVRVRVVSDPVAVEVAPLGGIVWESILVVGDAVAVPVAVLGVRRGVDLEVLRDGGRDDSCTKVVQVPHLVDSGRRRRRCSR